MKVRASALWSRGGILFLVLGIALLPSFTNWALQERNFTDDEGGDLQRISPSLLQTPELYPRPEGLSPLTGASYDYNFRNLSEPDTLYTSTGVFRVSDPDNQRWMPADLGEPATVPARGAGLKPGALNYALLSEKGRQQASSVERRIAELGGRVVGLVRGGYLMWVDPKGIGELRQSDLFRAFSPMPRAHKIFPDVGIKSLIQKSRAQSPDMQLLVEVISGLEDAGKVEKRLSAHASSVRAIGEHYGLKRYEVVADTAQTRKLAGIPWVVSISEPHEMLLQSYEAVPVLQVGSFEDYENERPLWAAGLDGTGQIIALADNGVSLDQPGLSHTSTDPGTVLQINFKVPGPHRKFEFFSGLADELSCDSPASGGSTHGNVIAHLIAGNSAKDFGTDYLANYIPNRAELLTGIDLDGMARGARLVFSDIGTVSQCLLNELVEVGGNVTVPGNDMFLLMEQAYDKGARLGAYPFATPNMDSSQFVNCGTSAPCVGAVDAGAYTVESRDVDFFLASHLEYMAFLPASNNGGEYPRQLGRIKDAVPDAFDSDVCNNNVDATFDCGGDDGTTTDDGVYCASCCGGDSGACPAVTPPSTSPVFMMIQAPATAKNDVTVGSSRSDLANEFGTFNAEDVVSNFTSKGPEGPSMRFGPTITTVGMDDEDVFGAPRTQGLAALSSRDNDQAGPVDGPDDGRPLVLDDNNTGTSYAVGTATGTAAIVKDYFNDGFYPTGTPVALHEIPELSGALVKAMLIMSTNHIGATLGLGGQLDRDVARNRCGTFVGGTTVVAGNNEQGCGRPVLVQGLPLANWPDTNTYPLIGGGTPEQAAAGLVVWDFIATPGGDLGLFTAAESDTGDGTGDSFDITVYKSDGQLRCALAWIDPPAGPADTAGLLINDLNLTVTDNTTAEEYHGNVYGGNDAGGSPLPGGWSRVIVPAEAAAIDHKNPTEAVHVNNPTVGTWTIKITGDSPLGYQNADEDANNNNVLDLPGEDTDADGILDVGGQPYAVVCSGPILTPAQDTSGGSHTGTGNLTRLNRSEYTCSEELQLSVFDPNATDAVEVTENVELRVLNSVGATIDIEVVQMNLSGGSQYLSDLISIIPESPDLGNGVLEVEDDSRIEATYDDQTAGVPDGFAFANVSCKPNMLASFFGLAGERNQTALVGDGCDGDLYLDEDEKVSFSIAFCNESRTDTLLNVKASLAVDPSFGITTAHPNAITIVEPTIDVGTIPPGFDQCGVPPVGAGFQSIHFELNVASGLAGTVAGDPTKGKAKLILTLEAGNQGRDLGLSTMQQEFIVAVVADKEILKYSTDHPAGGTFERDIDRDGLIATDVDNDNIPDVIDDAINAIEESITFAAIPVIHPSGSHTGNTCTEDADGDGILDPGEDIGLDGVAGTGDTGEGNGTLDQCIYADRDGPGGIPNKTFIPWRFDADDGGYGVQRDSITEPGIPALAKSWENIRSGACGFQTATADGDPAFGFQNSAAGVWKTGDGLTPDTNGDGQISPAEASAYNDVLCHNYSLPVDPDTATGTEIVVDNLVSSIITKINQSDDDRGLPFTTEFRRLGFNVNAQIADLQARLVIDLDNDLDDATQNAIVGENDRYAEDRAPHDLFQIYGPMDPTEDTEPQDTFGPLIDPDCSLGEDVGLDGIPASFDATECNGLLNVEDTGCDFTLVTAQGDPRFDAHQSNGDPPNDESGCPGGGPPGGTDCGCDGVVATCGASDFGEDLNYTRTFDAGEDVGCDGILAICSAGATPEPVGDGATFEVEPNEAWFGGTPVVPSAAVHGKIANGDAVGWNDTEDGIAFDTTALGAQNVTLTLAFDALDDDATATDFDMFLISLPPLPFAIVTSAASSANPEVISIGIDAGPHVVKIDSWGPVGNTGTANYTLTVVLGNDDVGCSTGEGAGDGLISLPPDTGEGNGTPDYPPDPGEGDGFFTTEDLNSTGALEGEDSNSDGIIQPLIATGVLTGDESGFPGFTINAPGFIVAVGTPGHEDDFGKLPLNADVRNIEAEIVGYEESEGVGGVNNPGLSYSPGGGGNRWAIGWEWRLREQDPPQSDFGVALDDVVFEWQEVHAGNETTAACDKFFDGATHLPRDPCEGGLNSGATCTADADCHATASCAATNVCEAGNLNAGDPCTLDTDCDLTDPDDELGACVPKSCSNLGVQDVCDGGDTCVGNGDGTCPFQDERARFFQAGSQCASIAASRAIAYRCEEAIPVTVQDPGTVVTGDADGDGVSDVKVLISSDSSPDATVTEAILNETTGAGTYGGSIIISQLFNSNSTIFVAPGTEANVDLFYPDPDCDLDGDQTAGEIDFNNPAHDDDGDGIPDDILQFNMTAACSLDTANISLIATEIDANACLGDDGFVSGDDTCDGDSFADSGEKVRFKVTVKNNGPGDLTNVVLGLTTADGDISCITDATAFLPSLPEGVNVTTDVDAFEFVVADTANTVIPSDPVRLDAVLTIIANEATGTALTIALSLPGDLDVDPLAPPETRIPGQGGFPDGTWFEGFEGPHTLSTKAMPGPDNLLGNADDIDINWLAFDNVKGNIFGGAVNEPPADAGDDGIVGTFDDPVAAGNPPGTLGFDVILCPDIQAGGREYGGDPGCQMDDSQWNDWHLHPQNAADGQDIPYQTPLDGDQAHGGTTSLHWGKHMQAGRGQWFLDDTYSLRQVAAFVTDPINLTVNPIAGDLQLEFQHIALMMDNNRVNLAPLTAADKGQIQISVDLDPDPGIDDFGDWGLLVPFVGGYFGVAKPQRFTGNYCMFSPTDQNPDNLMCNANPIFSHQGNQQGPAFTTYSAQGPVSDGSVGTGQWVLSQTNLADFIGQRVQIRWLGTSWELFQTGWDSYLEFPEGGSPFALGDDEDGWWVDQIKITGVIEDPAALAADTTNAFSQGFSCTEDLNGNGILDPGEDINGNGTIDPIQRDDGIGSVALNLEPSSLVTPGTLVTLNASDSFLGCGNSVIQFKFSKAPDADTDLVPDGPSVLLKDWSSNPTTDDAPTASTLYTVAIRCSVNSSDPAQVNTQDDAVASKTALLEVFETMSRPATIRSLSAKPGSSTDLSWDPAAIGLQGGAAAVNRYEVRRVAMVEGGSGESIGFPQSSGNGIYTGLAAIGGKKYDVGGAAHVISAGPICDDALVNGDDRFFDNKPGVDSMELPCFDDPSIACFTDTADPTDLAVGGSPPGYYYVVTSGLGNQAIASQSPGFRTSGSHSSRPNSLPSAGVCP